MLCWNDPSDRANACPNHMGVQMFSIKPLRCIWICQSVPTSEDLSLLFYLPDLLGNVTSRCMASASKDEMVTLEHHWCQPPSSLAPVPCSLVVHQFEILLFETNVEPGCDIPSLCPYACKMLLWCHGRTIHVGEACSCWIHLPSEIGNARFLPRDNVFWRAHFNFATPLVLVWGALARCMD